MFSDSSNETVVTPATVFGAIDVYLLLGLAFSFLYHGLQTWSGEPYFASDVEGTRNTFTYFSFVSLTTLGYGDFTPASNAGRSLAVVEVVIGQILLAPSSPGWSRSCVIPVVPASPESGQTGEDAAGHADQRFMLEPDRAMIHLVADGSR